MRRGISGNMEEHNCFVSGWENTKYLCISCAPKVCNVCSVPCTPSETVYSEENYTIGKCDDCDGRIDEPSEEIVVAPKAKAVSRQTNQKTDNSVDR